MRLRRSIALIVLLTCVGVACSENQPTVPVETDTTTPPDTQLVDTTAPPPDTTPPEPDTTPPPLPDTVSSTSGDVGTGNPANLKPPPPKPAPRARQRVNLDQLQASILKATGGITATLPNGQNSFEFYAASLGYPDFETAVQEDREPGLLFDKLIGDAARNICPKFMTAEQTAAPEDRIFIKHAALDDTVASAPDKIAKNLRMLILRFHGRYLAVDSPEITPWVALFEAVSTESEIADPITGWSAICTTLLTHPDFVSY
jgi:hypothetical protein